MSSTPSDEPRVLRLGHPRPPWRLSVSSVNAWAEAAAICLNECSHGAGVTMSVVGIPQTTEVLLDVPEVDESMRRTHRNLKPAAEKGAEAVVASLIHDLTDDIFIEQAVDHTGIDYWIARRDDAPLFQNTTRIEISGILRESASNTVEYRIRKKRERLDKYPDEWPAKIAVVEFSAPKAVMEEYG